MSWERVAGGESEEVVACCVMTEFTSPMKAVAMFCPVLALTSIMSTSTSLAYLCFTSKRRNGIEHEGERREERCVPLLIDSQQHG